MGERAALPDDTGIKEVDMHPMGPLLASIHHEDELRRAAAYRIAEGRREARRHKVDRTPSIRERILTAFRPIRARPAGA